ncbi:MAG TPA: TonB-dependent receptor [Candidatus Baltobacteraceae bacterium]
MSLRLSLRLVRCIVLLLVTLLVQGTWALAGTTGGVDGTIVDEHNAPVANASVTISSPSQNANAMTDGSGHFRFLSLAPDTYIVSVTKTGFAPASRAGISVFSDQTQSITIQAHSALRTIASVTSRSNNDLVKSGVTADVYSVSPGLQRASAALSSGTNLNSAYSAIASVPGVFVPIGNLGWGQTINIRGGNYQETGNEYDGIPINRAFDQYAGSALSSLGNQEVQVYTGAAPADAQANGLAGFVNQVVRTGTYPGFGVANLGIGSPGYYHKASVEAGGASPNRMFSYYAGVSGYTQDLQLLDHFDGVSFAPIYGNGQGTLYNIASIGCGGANPSAGCYTNAGSANVTGGAPLGPNGYAAAPVFWGFEPTVTARDSVANFHFGIPHKKDGGRDDVQLLYDVSQTYNANNSAFDSWGVAFGDVLNGTIGGPNGLPNCARAGLTDNCAINPAVVNTFNDANVYTGARYGRLTPGDLNLVKNVYFAGSTSNRPLDGPVSPNQRDSETTGFAVTKLQYQHNMGSNAYARIYGYTLYSDRIDNGVVGSHQNYVGAFQPDYVITSHTSGVAATLADQINQKNLLTFDAAYTTSSSVRDRNDVAGGVGESPIAYLVNAGSPNGGCFAAQTGTFAAKQVSCGTASTYVLPPLGGSSLVPGNPGVDPTVGTESAYTCGGGPCEYVTINNGQTGARNTVKPQFTNLALQDLFKPSERLTVNLALRYEDFKYVMQPTGNLGNQLFVNDYNASHCISGSTIARRGYGTDCAAGFVPTNLSTASPNLDFRELSPRVGFTYTTDSNNVFRFSYGRFTQPAQTSAVEATNVQAGVPSTAFYSGFGFNSFSRQVVPEVSYNADFSWEHQIRDSDVSFKLTPFYRKTNDEFISILVNPKTNFVANVNGLNLTSSGVEFSVRKGDFNRNGLSAQLAYTYTHAIGHYKIFPTGASFVSASNQGIQTYNAYTSFCANAANAKDARCAGSTTSGTAAPCYTTAGAADPACAPGSVANPYWNAAPAGLLDPSAAYAVFDTNLGVGSTGAAASYVAPHVASLILNYRHNRLAITPSFQIEAGSKYGSPLVAQGIAPDTCGATLGNALGNDPRYVNGSPGGGSPYDASSCSAVVPIPDPLTRHFDGIGEFTQPTVLATNLQVTYDVSPKITLQVIGANIYDRCFGGSREAWVIGSLGCAYNQAAPYVGNFYNPGDRIQTYVANPYGPVLATSLQTQPAQSALPFNLYFTANIKF